MKSKMTETSLGEEKERFDKQQVSLMAIKGSEIYYFITSALMQIVYVFDKRQAEIFEVMLLKKVVIVKKP